MVGKILTERGDWWESFNRLNINSVWHMWGRERKCGLADKSGSDLSLPPQCGLPCPAHPHIVQHGYTVGSSRCTEVPNNPRVTLSTECIQFYTFLFCFNGYFS